MAKVIGQYYCGTHGQDVQCEYPVPPEKVLKYFRDDEEDKKHKTTNDGKPKLLDVFCGAGGCARGYQRSGFFVVGIDNKPQPRYVGDAFIPGDALLVLELLLAGSPVKDVSGRDWWLRDFAAVHGSPPCQFGSEATPIEHRSKHPNLIPQTRELFQRIGKPYVIENVENVAKSHLINPIKLCGSMIGLHIWRHRYFETPNFFCLSPGTCNHSQYPITVHTGSNTRKTMILVLCTGGGDGKTASRRTHRPREKVDVIRWAMEIDWMTRDELSEAIPPAFTEFIGNHLMAHLLSQVEAAR